MAKVADFIDYIAMHATDAGEDILSFHIQEAVTDFLIDTSLAKAFYRFSTLDRVNDYVMDIPQCHTILMVKSVKVGDSCQSEVDWVELEETHKRSHYGYYTDIDNEGEPAIWIGDHGAGKIIEVEYSYTLGRGSCDIPRFVYTKYARVIQNLALSKLYSVVGQEWSNPQLAISYLRLYEAEVAKIKRITRKTPSGKFISKPFIGGRAPRYGGFFG